MESWMVGSPTYWAKIDLIKDVCDATCANPYWLEADYEETLYEVDLELTAQAAEHGKAFGFIIYLV